MIEKEEQFKKTEAYKKIEENSKKITMLLRENEKILKDNGFEPPIINMMLTEDASIKFPSNYIRTAGYFRKEYHLKDIFVKEDDDVAGKNMADNCAYALIESDIYNFWINRFGFWGIVESLIYKDGIINFVSIIEAMISEGAKKYSVKCAQCKYRESCCEKILPGELKKKTKNGNRIPLSFAEYVDVLEKKGFVRKPFEIFDVNVGEESVYQNLKTKKDIRNYVHITKSDVNSLNNDQFNLKNYNECLKLLQIFSMAIYERIVQQENCFEREPEMEMI